MTFARHFLISALCTTFASMAVPLHAQETAQRLPTVKLNAGLHLIEAEVAHTPQQRATGLMHRKEMPANRGMLFVFEQSGVQCFWMKNTLLPLSIAFLADDGTVVNLADMTPGSLDSHCSREPVRLALEMNRGWFERRGIREGSRLSGAAFQHQRQDEPAKTLSRQREEKSRP